MDPGNQKNGIFRVDFGPWSNQESTWESGRKFRSLEIIRINQLMK